MLKLQSMIKNSWGFSFFSNGDLGGSQLLILITAFLYHLNYTVVPQGPLGIGCRISYECRSLSHKMHILI